MTVRAPAKSQVEDEKKSKIRPDDRDHITLEGVILVFGKNELWFRSLDPGTHPEQA